MNRKDIPLFEAYPYELKKFPSGGTYVKRDRAFDHASDFLYSNPELGGMPDQQYCIGIEFEVGGAYEDWGFVVYRKVYKDKQKHLEPLATGRNLESAIYSARKKIRQEFEEKEDKSDLCYRCQKNKMAVTHRVGKENKPLCLDCFTKIGTNSPKEG